MYLAFLQTGYPVSRGRCLTPSYDVAVRRSIPVRIVVAVAITVDLSKASAVAIEAIRISSAIAVPIPVPEDFTASHIGLETTIRTVVVLRVEVRACVVRPSVGAPFE